MCIQGHYNVNVHASKQEGRKSCAQKQYLAISKFTAGGESKDERIIYTSPLPGVNIDAVEEHMECHQHEGAAERMENTLEILKHQGFENMNPIYRQRKTSLLCCYKKNWVKK
jgi:hypothetical protein